MVPLLKELERQGNLGLQPDAPQLAAKASREFQRLEKFLTEYLDSLASPAQLAKTEK